MTLRARLALAVVVLTAVGLVGAAVVTYFSFKRSTLNEVDTTLRKARSAGVAAIQLERARREGSVSRRGDVIARVLPLSPGGIIALRTRTGTVTDALQFGAAGDGNDVNIDVPTVSAAQLSRAAVKTILITTDGYRVMLTPVASGGIVEIAEPLTNAQNAVDRLLFVELIVGAGILVLVGGGGYLVVRREMRPLDRIAATADTIAAGDLSHRIPDEGAGAPEVDRVGRAFNGMLDRLEVAFRAREISEERLRTFLADASHELRTPLTAIRGYADMFDRGLADRPDDLRMALRRISEESVRLGGLVDDMMLLSQLDSERPLRVGQVDLTALAVDAAADARAADPDRSIAVRAAGVR